MDRTAADSEPRCSLQNSLFEKSNERIVSGNLGTSAHCSRSFGPESAPIIEEIKQDGDESETRCQN